jgi:predicted nucleic acid-binding protein
MNTTDALRGVRRLFLDTAPVIYHVEGVAAYQSLTDLVFQLVGREILEAVTSFITLAECLVHPYRRGDTTLVQRFRDVITAGVHTHYVDAEKAAELRAQYNLSLTDAFQIAAALAADCEAFLTNDTTLKRVNELRVLVLGELQVL